ncbi:MAG: hypothetical protein HY299_02045 [Verrucomicrobia bacterium]|nr:hypothetical protein [Verrucomicrobiota bacterium]
MNETKSIPRRGPEAAARRARILADFNRSGLSAYAFARELSLPYTTLIHWLKKPKPKRIAFTEVKLPAPTSEPLVLELGPQTRLPLSSPSQIALAVELLKRFQA